MHQAKAISLSFHSNNSAGKDPNPIPHQTLNVNRYISYKMNSVCMNVMLPEELHREKSFFFLYVIRAAEQICSGANSLIFTDKLV